MGHPLNLVVTLLIIYLAVGVQSIMRNYYKIKDNEETENNIWGKIAKKLWEK